jgi:hypothetical protein
VPYYIHDYYGPGRHAKIVSTAAHDLIDDGHEYHEERPLTGDESRVAEVHDVPWPELLHPVDDLPPATIVTSVQNKGGTLLIRGVSHDNGEIVGVSVNGKNAKVVASKAGVVDWTIEIPAPADGRLIASARDDAGNVEQTAHQMIVSRLSLTMRK